MKRRNKETRVYFSFLALGLMLTGCICVIQDNGTASEVKVELTPLSGRFGYALKSDVYDFQGTLTKENLESSVWLLSGEFTFPTGGYKVLPADITVAISYPEQVKVVLKVVPPPPGSIVIQVITQAPVNENIQAANEAKFDIKIQTIKRQSNSVNTPQ